MSQPTILFEGVWKKFQRGERHNSLRDLLPSVARRCGRRRRSTELEPQEFWALRDVSFEVRPGEAHGIIGPNGAGKSTILKLLTRILRPNVGRCSVAGRVGALIEVSAGFHPDLTGRENIFLQGALMGMRRHEVVDRLDEIVDFAGVSEFIDTPVKRYSSGMNARLGFSIAAHLRPTALIIDEVLSVGDMSFQQKCLSRMRRFREEGVAIVFVSHNLAAVAELCHSCMLIQRGQVHHAGPPALVVGKYIEQSIATEVRSDAIVQIAGAQFQGNGASRSAAVTPGASLTLRVTYRAHQPVSDLTFGFIVYRSSDRLVVYDGNLAGSEIAVDAIGAGEDLEIDFRFSCHLTRGQYHVECHVFHNPTQTFLARLAPAAFLTVAEYRTFSGVADLAVEPRLVRRFRTHAAIIPDADLLLAGQEVA